MTIGTISKRLNTCIARNRTPRLRRSTLIKVRYKMGLMLEKYRREHLNGHYDNCSRQTEVYKYMDECVHEAMEILLKETKMIEDDATPKRLKQRIIPA